MITPTDSEACSPADVTTTATHSDGRDAVTRGCSVAMMPALRSRGRPNNMNGLTHGHSVGGVISRTYRSWQMMWQRCTNPRFTGYSRYGGRGIAICKRWGSFAAFLSDMGERPPGTSIDRINNDGNYTPKNCRWATSKEQASNHEPVRGERNGNAKLSDADAAVIRATPNTYGSRVALARKYGVAPDTISDIRNGRRRRVSP